MSIYPRLFDKTCSPFSVSLYIVNLEYVGSFITGVTQPKSRQLLTVLLLNLWPVALNNGRVSFSIEMPLLNHSL